MEAYHVLKLKNCKLIFALLIFISNTFELTASLASWENKSLSYECDEDSYIEARYTLTNNSSKKIRISKVVPSCGCVHVDYDTAKYIEPGSKANIKLKISAAGKPADFKVYAIVSYENDPDCDVIYCELKLKGIASIRPQVITWNLKDTIQRKEIIIKQQLKEELLIEKIDISNDFYLVNTNVDKNTSTWTISITPKKNVSNTAVVSIYVNDKGRKKIYYAILKNQTTTKNEQTKNNS